MHLSYFLLHFHSSVLMGELMIGFVILQSLLAALGSIQFVSNIAFAYFVLNKTISVKYVCSSLSGNWDKHYNQYMES